MNEPTVKIKAAWLWSHLVNGKLVWMTSDEQIFDARVTPRTYIFHYDNANNGQTKVMLRRFQRYGGNKGSVMTRWIDRYGRRDEPPKKIEYTLL